MQKVETSLIQTGKYLLTKLPLKNKVLICLASLDPSVRGHAASMKKMIELPELLQLQLSTSESDNYSREVMLFHRDMKFSEYNDKEDRVDDWYNHNIFKEGEYSTLSKVVKTGLSIFTSPHVESSFNLMKDIIDDRSTNMNVNTFSSVQTIKFHLRSRGKSSVQYWGKRDHLHDEVDRS